MSLTPPRYPEDYRPHGNCRRTKVISRFSGEISCLTLVWAVLDRASRGWRGLTMTTDGLRLLQDLRRSLSGPPTPAPAALRRHHLA